MKRILILVILMTGMAAAQTTLGPTNIVLLGIGTYNGATLASRFPAANWQWYVAWVTDGPTCGGGGAGPAVLCYSNGANWTPVSTGGGGGPGGGGITSINNSTLASQSIVGAGGITVATVVGTGVTTVSLPPPALASMSLSPASVVGGANSTGTVTLSSPAPTGGVTVTLSSSNTSAATVPASVTVAAGATSATFTVSTLVVSSNTSATITGVSGATKTATLAVNIPQPIYGGPGQPGATSSVTLVGNTVHLSTGDTLNQLQNTPEQVGQSWSFTTTNQVVYLILFGNAHTFTDANTGFPFVMNAPITVNVGGVTMYLYQSSNSLTGSYKPRVAS